MSTSRPVAEVLVLGVGNALLGDEGIGVHVARALRRRGPPRGVEVVDGGTTGFELLPWFENRDRVVLVDAIRASGEPGTIYRIPAEEVADDLPAASSAHGSDIGALLRSARSLDRAPEIVLVGVVPEASDRPALDLSPSLRRRFEEIAAFVLTEAARATRPGS